MYNPQASFRNILDPVKSEQFFASDYGRSARYIPGPPDKFTGLFDWQDLNRQLGFDKVWDSHTVKLVIDGEPVPPQHYCPHGLLDRTILAGLLDQGATMALIGCETLNDGAAALYKSIQAATGGLCGANLYFSQKGRAGFKPHFDLMDVIVIHLSGEKKWNIYETRFADPMFKPGFHHMSFNRDYHEQNKGAIEAEVTMTPGDVLYLPRGKYHAALATTESSLHITFGIELPRGYNYLQALIETLPEDPLFREAIPHFDAVEAHQAYLTRLADRMREKMADPDVIAEMAAEQRRKACHRLAEFTLPRGSLSGGYRVRVCGSKLVRRGASWRLITPTGQTEISPGEADIVKWMLQSDLFARNELTAAHPQLLDADATTGVDTLLDSLYKVGLIDPI